MHTELHRRGVGNQTRAEGRLHIASLKLFQNERLSHSTENINEQHWNSVIKVSDITKYLAKTLASAKNNRSRTCTRRIYYRGFYRQLEQKCGRPCYRR